MHRLKNISPPDAAAMERARERWNSVAKPLHSLGLLEDAVVKIAGIKGSECFELKKRVAVVMCADNGVVSEGVTQTDSAVTAVVAAEAAAGRSSVNCLAAVYGAEVLTVDMGMKAPVPGVLDRRIAAGTGNIADGPAMSRDEAERAVAAGIDIMRGLKENGTDIVAAGEMGIGNTATSAAVASALLNLPPELTVGRGAGIDGEGFKRKIHAVRRALEINRPDPDDPMEVLSKLGGFDIAGMTGLFLGGAVYGTPVIIDGLISLAAAALAVKIAPMSREYMLASHASKEPAAKTLAERLGLSPVITAGLALGEGTGALMLLPLLDGALAVYNGAHRFDELPMERYVELC